MLPIHRSSPSEAGLSSCISKRPSFVLTKPLVRWLVLACVVVAFIWFGDLLNPGRSSEPLSRLADSLNTPTTTTGQQSPSNIPSQPNIPPPQPDIPPPQPTKEVQVEQDVWELRKNEVRNAFKHAWSGYKNIAYPNDELLSLSGGHSNKFFFPSPPSYLSFLLIFFII